MLAISRITFYFVGKSSVLRVKKQRIERNIIQKAEAFAGPVTIFPIFAKDTSKQKSKYRLLLSNRNKHSAVNNLTYRRQAGSTPATFLTGYTASKSLPTNAPLGFIHIPVLVGRGNAKI